MKFWNMPWGPPAFNVVDKALVESYVPPAGLPRVTYGLVEWATWTQTFATAVDSGTGPAVSSGGGIQAFQFAAEGKIAYADHLIETLKAKNLYNNFLPGLFEAMKTPAGYVAVPYQVDVRVWYYNKALLEKAGAEVPTDWPSYISAGKKLAKIGAYGFGLGGGSGNNVGSQVLVSLMIANGGGLFDEYQKPNCVTERNIEAMEFVLECYAAGMVAPGCAVYTLADVYNQWTAGKFAMGGSNMGLKTYTSGAASKDLVVMPPFKGPHGTEGTFMSPNNIMMYKETPTQAGSEAFLLWYLEHMHVLWDKGVFPDLPVQKSVEDSPAVKLDTELYDEASLWLPVGKTYGAPGGSALFAGIGAVDGAPPLLDFAQTMLEGKTSAKGALQTLQSAITSAL